MMEVVIVDPRDGGAGARLAWGMRLSPKTNIKAHRTEALKSSETCFGSLEGFERL
jgi:hypothetical protein